MGDRDGVERHVGLVADPQRPAVQPDLGRASPGPAGSTSPTTRPQKSTNPSQAIQSADQRDVASEVQAVARPSPRCQLASSGSPGRSRATTAEVGLGRARM